MATVDYGLIMRLRVVPLHDAPSLLNGESRALSLVTTITSRAKQLAIPRRTPRISRLDTASLPHTDKVLARSMTGDPKLARLLPMASPAMIDLHSSLSMAALSLVMVPPKDMAGRRRVRVAITEDRSSSLMDNNRLMGNSHPTDNSRRMGSSLRTDNSHPTASLREATTAIPRILDTRYNRMIHSGIV